MSTQTLKDNMGAIPNFLGERNYEEIEAQCVALFAAVAVEKDPAKRLALQIRRDELRLLILRRRNEAEEAKRHIGWYPSSSAANSPRSFRGETSSPDADTSNDELCWYCRAPEGDPLRESIDILARRCVAASAKDGHDRRDILSAALYRYAMLLAEEPGLPDAKRVNRSVAWALHHLMREDFAEHNSRERTRSDADFRKWTWRLTDEVVEAVWPGLRAALKADITSAETDFEAFGEDIDDFVMHCL